MKYVFKPIHAVRTHKFTHIHIPSHRMEKGKNKVKCKSVKPWVRNIYKFLKINKWHISSQVVYTVGKDEFSFFVFIFWLCDPWVKDWVVLSPTFSFYSTNSQPLWLGDKIACSSSQLPTSKYRMVLMGVLSTGSPIAELVQIYKFEVPIFGI